MSDPSDNDLVLVSSVNMPELLQFIGIDERTAEQGRKLAALLDEHGEAIFSTFYNKISTISFCYKFEHSQVDSLKAKQMKHWKALFTKKLDINYARNAAIVGNYHRNIDVGPLLYIIGYSVIKVSFMELIARMDVPPMDKGRLIGALEKYISLDIALAMVGYSGSNDYESLFSP